MYSYHGGLLWIDLINTESLENGVLVDTIADEDLFDAWFSGLPQPQIQSLHNSKREYTLSLLKPRLLDLRAWLRECAEVMVEQHSIPKNVINTVNERLARIKATPNIVNDENQLQLIWHPVPTMDDGLDLLFLWSFADFLANDDINRLKACGSSECIQFFYDVSKNNTRRWCRMDTCGNQEKARRHYKKVKQQGEK